jgi:hypothetical protein
MEMAKSIILDERPDLHERLDLEILKVIVALAEMPEENKELIREIKAKIRQIKAEMEVD